MSTEWQCIVGTKANLAASPALAPTRTCKPHLEGPKASHLCPACMRVFKTSKGDAMTVERTAEKLAAATGLKSATAPAWAMIRLALALLGILLLMCM